MASKKRKADQESDLIPQSAHNHQEAVEDELFDEDEDIGKLLEPLSREQLVDLLRRAATSDPAILSEIQRLADADPAHRKLFVHGLGWETTTDTLRLIFSRYGELDDCRVVVDKGSGRSKGYGFVLFHHRRSARAALRQPQKLIEGRMTACQLASAGPPQTPAPNPNTNPNPSSNHDNLPRKIYVGNVHSDIDGSRLRSFFGRYGEIEEGPIGFDRQTGKPKGFALFVYKTLEGARKALEEPNKNFEGHILFCQKATDSNKSRGSVAPPAPGSVAPNAMAAVPIGNTGGYDAPGFGATVPDMGLAQQAAMLGQGLLGGMQPNAAALAVLAAAGQNPAAFGINPAMLAQFNPALAAAAALGAGGLGTGAQSVVNPSAVPPTQSMQGYGMASSGYQSVGYQGPPGFQGQPQMPQSGGTGTGASAYQGGPIGQGPNPRPPVGQMGGYGAH
ncbi:UBP1-associated protein 2B-like [Dioscorea cayenensis subsp. rotundata]|uniref:UBP1-associated protein 2B-like n=1 Tax=Dioscorea cayennensis subsp. rotundata TaxID=55577 RepID=A0AB40AIZ8_DIOCR|nr:UBP1-associated protein 2B-like [Dioscorea cayenensis subsp. rotundata]